MRVERLNDNGFGLGVWGLGLRYRRIRFGGLGPRAGASALKCRVYNLGLRFGM